MREIKGEIIKLEKVKGSTYFKSIGFIIVLLLLSVLLNSMGYGKFESLASVLTILILIILIPLNQIFRIKRIHIYQIIFNDQLVIYYQDLIKKKKVEVSIDDLNIQLKDTSIRGCSKLVLNLPDRVLNQYCNQFWSNATIKEIKDKLTELKNRQI